MPKLIPVGFADCALHFTRTADLEEMLITFGVEIVDPLPPGQLAIDISSAFKSAFPSSAYPAVVKYVRATARIGQEGGEETVEEKVENINGSASIQVQSSNCALLVKKRSNRGGRRGRGRMFVPWLDSTKVDPNGIYNATQVTTEQGRWTTFHDLLEVGQAGNPTPMVVLHNSEGNSPPGTPTRVTQLVVDPIIATQRRRLRP